MHILSEAFNLATSIGLWEPPYWRSSFARRTYKAYTCFTYGVIVLLMVAQVVGTLLLTRSVDDFAEATYMLLSTINASIKGGTILLRRRHVIDLADMLLTKECVPRTAAEMKLCSHFHRISRYTVISCIILAEATVGSLALWPLLFAGDELILPLRAWYPYDSRAGPAYWFSYLHQATGLLLIAAYDVASDTVITGFMVQACAQLELMGHRLRQLSRCGRLMDGSSGAVIRALEKRIISGSVRHHLLIFRFTENINTIFAPIILVQFCLSSVVLCVTVYQLSVNKSKGIEVIIIILYLMSMLVEFFIYCWFGNEVTLKSLGFTTAICELDWTAMHVKTLNELLIMMIRSTSPILLSCGPLITLSLQSFMSILKVSYSAFNVLQQSD